ncbi:hypothetical protein BDN72DRAFT_115629 [Pluteus cervinus]|uniref:Uncharacterized protein n=1 Tax=Pluteus cervinus TaxID=181527 RepID=A0ACD3AN81_9AGAR|nr:hypothetical protein BDN72DRAFT_115629 [Pluteus cervinus]
MVVNVCLRFIDYKRFPAGQRSADGALFPKPYILRRAIGIFLQPQRGSSRCSGSNPPSPPPSLQDGDLFTYHVLCTDSTSPHSLHSSSNKVLAFLSGVDQTVQPTLRVVGNVPLSCKIQTRQVELSWMKFRVFVLPPMRLGICSRTLQWLEFQQMVSPQHTLLVAYPEDPQNTAILISTSSSSNTTLVAHSPSSGTSQIRCIVVPGIQILVFHHLVSIGQEMETSLHMGRILLDSHTPPLRRIPTPTRRRSKAHYALDSAVYIPPGDITGIVPSFRSINLTDELNLVHTIDITINSSIVAQNDGSLVQDGVSCIPFALCGGWGVWRVGEGGQFSFGVARTGGVASGRNDRWCQDEEREACVDIRANR